MSENFHSSTRICLLGEVALICVGNIRVYINLNQMPRESFESALQLAVIALPCLSYIEA